MSIERNMNKVHVRRNLAAHTKTAGARFARKSETDGGRSIPKLHRTKWIANPCGGGL